MITIQLFPSTFLILFALIFGITFFIYRIKEKRRFRVFFIGMVEVYILLLISTTILPVRIINPSLIEQESRLMDYVQLFPFRTIKEVLLYEGIGSIQIIGNIILFIPLPILIAYTSKKHNTFSVFIKSFFAPMGIEIIQFCMDILLKYPSRKFDVDDIILNTTGILIGLFIFKVIFYFKNP